MSHPPPAAPPVADTPSTIEVDGLSVDLRNRPVAALLAWLVPGAGHFYQGRTGKAGLLFVCILSLWTLGFALGGGHVVYASWAPGDRRWHYLLQVGAGAVALPAMLEGYRMKTMTDATGRTMDGYQPLMGGLMAPPHRPVDEKLPDEVAAWYARHGSGYELGTWYTMIAGLLNLLAIYDAYGGPLLVPISGRKTKAPHDKDVQPS